MLNYDGAGPDGAFETADIPGLNAIEGEGEHMEEQKKAPVVIVETTEGSALTLTGALLSRAADAISDTAGALSLMVETEKVANKEAPEKLK